MLSVICGRTGIYHEFSWWGFQILRYKTYLLQSIFSKSNLLNWNILKLCNILFTLMIRFQYLWNNQLWNIIEQVVSNYSPWGEIVIIANLSFSWASITITSLPPTQQPSICSKQLLASWPSLAWAWHSSAPSCSVLLFQTDFCLKIWGNKLGLSCAKLS